jgi:ATP-dependent Clp protease adaptor protein ClpS
MEPRSQRNIANHVMIRALKRCLDFVTAHVNHRTDLELSLSHGGVPTDPERSGGLATATSKPKLKRPPMYKVIILNDDYTPMEFVVHILERFFGMNREKATQVMLAIHTRGSAVVGIFPRDIAETKSEMVNQYAQENHHPLLSKIEMTD